MFTSPAAIAFSIGSFEIRYYGIIMSVAMIAGIAVMCVIGKKFFRDITFDEICDISFLLVITGIISARAYYVLLDYKYFLKYPLEIPAINHGGISIQGAIIGGIVAGIIYANRKKIDFFKYADLFSFSLITGQIIGRWGNFFNSEAFGLPTDLPWKLYIPYSQRPLEYKAYEYFHPAFLYESLLNIVVLGILFCILAKYKNRKNGDIFFAYLILYSFVRILTETIRIDSVMNVGIFHAAHIMCALFIAVSAGFIAYNHKRNRNIV